MNMYDFHKTRNIQNQECFQHQYFNKQRRDLLHLIKRKIPQ